MPSLATDSPIQIALGLLDFDEFQVFCERFLFAHGYRTQPGPRRGPDGGLDIIGYTPSGGRFLAHCTTISGRSHLRNKFVTDAVAGAASDKTGGLPRPNELIFFSVESAFGGNDQQSRFVTEVLFPKLQIVDPAFSPDQLAVFFYSGERIEVALSGHAFSDAKRMLQDKLRFLSNQLLSEESVLESEDFLGIDGGALTRVRRLLGDYESAPSEVERSILLPQVLECLWELAWNRDINWDAVTGACAHPQLAGVISVLSAFRLSALRQVRTDAVFQFILDARSYRSFNCDAFNRALDIFLCRIIKALFYRFPSVADQEDVRARIIEAITATPTPTMATFGVDLVFRHDSHYIRLHQDIYEAARRTAELYFETVPRSPLAEIARYLANPVESLPPNRPQFVDVFSTLAQRCRTGIEARWCITTFMRCLPLYAGDDIGEDSGDEVSTVIDSFDRTVLKESPTLIFFKLTRILKRAVWSYLSTRGTDSATGAIAEYERLFLTFRTHLHRVQRAHVQLE
ncbi:MAG: hypothetical protein ABSG12_14900, partial [Steroidobacteraceae bacterium]